MPLDSRELLREVNPIYVKVVSEDLPITIGVITHRCKYLRSIITINISEKNKWMVLDFEKSLTRQNSDQPIVGRRK
jgi:hypothetical protein